MKIVNGEVIVSYPVRVSRAEISRWVASQSEWILKHYSKPSLPQAFKPADHIYWLGQRSLLADAVGDASDIQLPAHFFEVPLTQQSQYILLSCARAAKKDLPTRVEHFQEKLGLYACSVKLRAYKSRWGSCSSKGELTLNYLLMMAPDWVRDYVVVHELCHLKHLNHSAFFWAEVARVFDKPRVKAAKSWLNKHGNQMLFIYR